MLAHVSFTPRRMVEIEKSATKTTRRRSEVTWFGEWGAVWNGGAGGRAGSRTVWNAHGEKQGEN